MTAPTHHVFVPSLLGVIALLSSPATAQMPLPPHGYTLTASTRTHGFFFQAPVNFNILGLEAKNALNQLHQVVEVIDFGTSPPPPLPATVTGTQLFYDNLTPSNRIIDATIPCVAGNWYGILGAATSGATSSTSYNAVANSGTFVSDILGQPVTLTALATQFAPESGIAGNGGNQPCGATFNIGRVDVYVAADTDELAAGTSFGQSCNERYRSFYEVFNGPMDLQNASLDFTRQAAGYSVEVRPLQWHTPTTAPVAIGDDEVVQLPLGWTFPTLFSGTTILSVSSNGYVRLRSSISTTCCPSTYAFLQSGRLAGLWNDLDPSAGGTVHVESDPVAGTAHVTFVQVPRRGTSDLNTFQFAFDSAGNMSVRYQACAAQTGTTLVGWSTGPPNVDPGPTDISAAGTIVTGTNDILRMTLSADARPLVGTSVGLAIDDIQQTTIFAGFLFGLTRYDPGLSLASIGMPGCFQYCSQDAVALTFLGGSTSASYTLDIPNDPAFASVHLYVQGASHCPTLGPNAGKPASSNALDLRIGVN